MQNALQYVFGKLDTVIMAAVKRFRAACKERVASCVTAWDFPTGRIAADAGMDLILIGDSTAVVSQGLESTAGMTLDEMIYHCKAVARGARRSSPGPFLLGDLPLGTYEVSPQQGRLCHHHLLSDPREVDMVSSR